MQRCDTKASLGKKDCAKNKDAVKEMPRFVVFSMDPLLVSFYLFRMSERERIEGWDVEARRDWMSDLFRYDQRGFYLSHKATKAFDWCSWLSV